ncbi:MAG: pilus assembly protein PilM [gamma proteobacterium symbiont of Bathyaustriella thionipta]|nr:pilus assembly protein PilM [gamma proteobacterium symbiont of Bathyaustriella thionipta]MCU7951066.1 pilus assembly protein PilM [gamma proteobacterium symbiont of Bathyaustriella thionipta]MCU7954820.1 pilus assembly protein PilM [gamma proteobacterium symbiont of Bathyaustriella thionipta]MCU7957566.1 pilus assembly protein PilM [gamma proteobacterium symbiont of Bathyaustriella thionipta]MCU7968884.1 pilus assembly protein PilM [gamma proteobacterium symbiont of Bathyaustriella thionipta
MAHILGADKDVAKPKLKQCAFETTVSDAEGNIEAQNQALSKVAKKFPISHFFCNSSIESSAYELLLIDAPNVESSELKQAVRWRIKDQLSYHIDDAIVDVFEIPGQQSSRSQLMYVVASQKHHVDQRAQQLKQINVALQSIDIYELTQRNIAAIMPEDKDGVVMLRFNEDKGLLTITRNGTLFLTRKIDFGVKRLMSILDQGIAVDDEIELSLDECEESDIVEHDAENSAELDKIEPQYMTLNEQGKLIVDEVVLEIQRSLDYYVSHFNQRPVTKIVFAPLVKEVPGVIEYINTMLGINVEVMDFNQYLDVAKPLSRELQAYCFDAIGLALRCETKQAAS